MSVLRCGTYQYCSARTKSSARRFVAKYLGYSHSSVRCKVQLQNQVNDIIEVQCVDVSHEGLGAFTRGLLWLCEQEN